MAMGPNALHDNTTGSMNVAIGQGALAQNFVVDGNVAVGFQALTNNFAGSHNTAVGFQALFSNKGQSNTATGFQALFSNYLAVGNTANGDGALYSNTGGGLNTATGALALINNTIGENNTADGAGALASNTGGSANTADGAGALFGTIGSNNTALGFEAGYNLTTGSNNIDIGNIGVAGEAKTIRIGNTVATVYPDGLTRPAQTRTFIAGIRGRATTNANAIPVVIDSAGQLGTASSSRRFKNEIKPMDKASETILALKPVTFHYKSDSTGTPQFGLIAEEVAKVDPDLVVHDENGEIYTVRYDAVNAMLLNEFLKEHRKVQKLEATVARQRRDFQAIAAQQQKQIEALTAGLQKVSAQVELKTPAPQTVLNQ
jgi:endosialidase-like protein